MASQSSSDGPRRGGGRSGLIKSSQDFGGGLFLLGLAAFGYFGTANLKLGTLGGMGPGLLPKTMAVMLAAFGLLLIVESMSVTGSAMGRWSVRGPLFVLGAALLFALTVRPLGLVVAGPLAVLVSSLADRGVSVSRSLQMLVFAAVITAFCIGLFKYALGLPIPLAPWYFGY